MANFEEKSEEKKRFSVFYLTSVVKFILIILLIIGVGVFAVNQVLQYHYKTEFLMKPCQLCLKLNPHLKQCFNDASKVVIDERTGKVVNGPTPYNPYNITITP